MTMSLPALWKWAKDRGTEAFLVGMLFLGVIVNGMLFAHNRAEEERSRAFDQKLAQELAAMRTEHAAINLRLEKVERR